MKYTQSDTSLREAARKILELFDRRERWKLAGIFAALLGSGLLQMAGVASIMPFIAVRRRADRDLKYVRALADELDRFRRYYGRWTATAHG